MDRDEALKLLDAKLDEYRRLSYAEATASVGSEEGTEVTGSSGTAYQTEIQITCDGKLNGDVCVLGVIDDGGWRAFPTATK